MAGKCLNEVIDKSLRKIFYRHGKLVGNHPGYFIVVPILLTVLCFTGIQRMSYNYDPEYLFSPTNGQAKNERDVVEKYFPTNYTAFKANRITQAGKLGRLIITAKDNGSMLRTHVWDQMLYLDQVIYNITVKHENSNLSYYDLCAQWNYNCYDNEILTLSDIIPSIEVGEYNLTYPITFHPDTFEQYVLPAFFGGEVLGDDETTVSYVKAVSLSYFLDVSEDWKGLVGDKWEQQLLDDVQRFSEEYYPDLEVGMFVSNTPAWEMENSKLSITGLLIINTMALVLFSFIAAYRADNAKSKPWIGFFGLFSATLATVAGFGFCCYIGVEFISLNLAAPFLLFGIGLDDTFVVLSSWHRSSPHLPVPERMGRCFSDAAVSITVTSLTNFFSFMCGVITPFPCVRIFCLYTGISIAFIYIWHITLFAGIMALAGRAEKDNRHGLMACCKVTPKSLAQDKSWLYRTFMTGGINPSDPENPMDNKEHILMVFFRDRLGAAITNKWVKCLVLVLFAAYMSAAVWGFTNIKEGLDKKNTANYDSYSIKYYEMDDTYFKKYAFTISVVFSGPDLRFSNPETQQKIENILQKLENSTYIDADATDCWLRDFLDYIERNKDYSDVDLPISTEYEFADTLKSKYLNDPTSANKLDVSFDETNSRVTAARFLIQGYNIKTSLLEQKMVEDLREICTMYSTDELEITVFQPFFIYIDQYIAILPQAVQTILVTALVMVVIALFLIPSIVCSIWVSFSIVSIEIGVIGFMTLWGINLDGVALINLIMCIGFSVDFSAHICYHYMTAEAEEIGGASVLRSSTRIRASLYALGLPIIQGAASTILGVFGLAFANCYLFVTFFKMIFLVIVLGALHGLVLLPVLLSIFGPDQCRSISNYKRNGKSKKLQSYESSAISTPTITTFSKRKIHGNNGFHINNLYNGGVVGFNGGINTMKNTNNYMNQQHPHHFSQHSVYESDDHDGIESICSCTINMGYMNDQTEHQVEKSSPMTTYEYYDDRRQNRSKYFTSPENLHDINMYRGHKLSIPSTNIATETTSTEQSSPSTLSTPSNSGRRVPRVHRHLQQHAKLVNHGPGNRLARYRHHRHQTSRAPSHNLHHNGGVLMLKNGVVLSPSQLMVLKDGPDNTVSNVSKFRNSDASNNQLTVVVVENRSDSTNENKANRKMEISDVSCNTEAKYSDTTTPATSTSSSSSSSPSNIRCSSSTKSNNSQNNTNWCNKLHRTSSNLPGRVTKHGGGMKHGHIPSSTNASPKSSKRSSKRENIDNHRHRKVFKTRSHTNKLASNNEWSEYNLSKFDPTSFQNVISIDEMPQKSQNYSKKCLYKTKSDFGGNMNGHISAERQVVPIESIITLSNNLLANAPTSSINSVTKISNKQPLKKSNTFPYEKLHSDTTSCSSENESIGCEKNHKERNINEMVNDKRLNEVLQAYHPSTNVCVNHTNHIRKR